jgi:formylglycine-generating enzyme required for sulfatase activity
VTRRELILGPEVEPLRANTSESGLGRSTAVGLYPLGASKAGLLDMAGTISEWCLNAYDDLDDTSFGYLQPGILLTGFWGVGDYPEGVVRGGSWNFTMTTAECPLRFSLHPDLRDYFLGFRVACSSPIMEPKPGCKNSGKSMMLRPQSVNRGLMEPQ